MQAYAKSLKGDTRFVLAPTSDFFRYFNTPQGTSASSPTTASPAPVAGQPQANAR
jgi:membrane protease subunit HflC